MKKIIIIAALFCSFAASAQKTTPGNYTYIAQKYEWDAGIFKGLGIPSGSGPAAFITGQVGRAGALYYDSVGTDSGFYVYTGTYWRNHSVSSGGTWGSITGTLSDQTDLQSALNAKQNLLVNSAGLLAALSDETGTGLSVFNTSPLFVTPRLNSTSTIGHVWTATDGSGNGSFQASAAGITGLTSPRIPYASSATTLTDDANFYRIVTPGIQGNTGFVSLGQAAFGGHFNLPQNRNKDYASNRNKSYGLESIHNDSLYSLDSTSSGAFAITSYENSTGGNSFHVRKARGTQLVPLPVQVGDRIYSFGAKGYATNGEFSNSAIAMLGIVEEQFTNLATGASLILETTAIGQNTREGSLMLHASGNVGIGPNSVVTNPSALLTLQSKVGTSPSFRLNDADVTLPSYSAVGFQPTLDAGTIFNVVPYSTTVGGTQVMGFSESGANTMIPLHFSGHHGGTAPTTPSLSFNSWKWNGTTGRVALASSEIVAQWFNGSTLLQTLIGSGNFGMGVTVPTAVLHLKAGTTAASTAPLKFTSGSLQTTAEAGAVEFLTDKFYGTITTSAARKEFTLNDAALTSGRIPFVTTNGRLTDVSTVLWDGTTATFPLLKMTGGSPGAGKVLTSDADGDATWTTAVKPTLTKNATIENPTASENMGMFRTPVAITITNTHAVLVGSGSPSVTYQISFGTDITALTNVYTAGQTVTSTTTGTAASGVNDATIPADSWIRITTSAQSGTVGQISLSITYTED